MIAYLEGKVRAIIADTVILDVNGVGYEVYMDKISLIKLSNIPSIVGLHINTIYSQDNVTLYGFTSYRYKVWFNELIKLSGVSGRIAMAIIGNINLDVLEDIIMNKDEKAISIVPGIGKKLASRIVNELDGRAAKVKEAVLLYQQNIHNDRPSLNNAAISYAIGSSATNINNADLNAQTRTTEITDLNLENNNNEPRYSKLVHDTIEALVSLGFQRASAYMAAHQSLKDLKSEMTAISQLSFVNSIKDRNNDSDDEISQSSSLRMKPQKKEKISPARKKNLPDQQAGDAAAEESPAINQVSNKREVVAITLEQLIKRALGGFEKK